MRGMSAPKPSPGEAQPPPTRAGRDDAPASAKLIDELLDWLRIPSASVGTSDEVALRRAAEWVVKRIRAAGGTAGLVATSGNPLVVGELRAAAPAAPTVLVYGHYDVQDPGPAEAWITPPFEPEIRGGRIYARGAADDKGNFLPGLHVACGLARAGALPVNVRVLVDGDEEVAGTAAPEWVFQDDGRVDCAIVLDSMMADECTPALTVATRGRVDAMIDVRTGERDLHSGLYGGTVLNAAHVLARMLGEVLPGPDGEVRPELRAGIVAPSTSEREGWSALPEGARVLAEAGARPLSARAAAEYYERTGADTALDVNEFIVGESRAIIPARARAMLSVRLAPGQSSTLIARELERIMRAVAPPAADVVIEVTATDPAAFDPATPALRLAARALEKAAGVPPMVIREGGTIAVLSALSQRGVPTIVTGFAGSGDQIHAPNESLRLSSLALGERAARELYVALAELPAGGLAPAHEV
jgi:acetylornithine deacetylase/succinyl-diaminopimelate desuccinylase-like protein